LTTGISHANNIGVIQAHKWRQSRQTTAEIIYVNKSGDDPGK